MDEAAAIIRSYLAHPSCSLQTLSLRSADVDDNECCFLMEAISRNQSLTKLDVSGKGLSVLAGFVGPFDLSGLLICRAF